MLLIFLPFGLRRNPVWRDSSNVQQLVKRERAVGDGYGIEGMGSDSGILLGIILYFCHFLSVLKGLTLLILEECELSALVVDALASLVEVFLVQFKADEVPTLLDASDGGRAAAHEWVEDGVTCE